MPTPVAVSELEARIEAAWIIVWARRNARCSRCYASRSIAHRRAELGHFPFETLDALVQVVRFAAARRRSARGWRGGRRTRTRIRQTVGGSVARFIVLVEQQRVALLLLPRPPVEPHDQLALDQPLQRFADGGEGDERVHPLGALLQLARRLRTTQHQHCHHRMLAVVEWQYFGEHVAVLRRPAATREAHETTPLEAVQSVADRRL